MPGPVYDLCTLHPPSFSTALFLLCMGMLKKNLPLYNREQSVSWAETGGCSTGRRCMTNQAERRCRTAALCSVAATAAPRYLNASNKIDRHLQPLELGIILLRLPFQLHSPASGSSPECAMLAPSLQTSCNTGYSARNSASAAAV